MFVAMHIKSLKFMHKYLFFFNSIFIYKTVVKYIYLNVYEPLSKSA